MPKAGAVDVAGVPKGEAAVGAPNAGAAVFAAGACVPLPKLKEGFAGVDDEAPNWNGDAAAAGAG